MVWPSLGSRTAEEQNGTPLEWRRAPTLVQRFPSKAYRPRNGLKMNGSSKTFREHLDGSQGNSLGSARSPVSYRCMEPGHRSLRLSLAPPIIHILCSFAVHSRTSDLLVYAANIYTYYYWYSISPSLFHSGLKTSLFCKYFPPWPSFFRTDHGFPGLFNATSEHIRFLLHSFFSFHPLLVVVSVR